MMLRRIAVAFLLLVLAVPGRAAPFTGLYVFGDSLSDVGNLFTLSGGRLPAPPYADGRFSNGPLWVESLGVVTPSLRGGNGFAYGGAHSGGSAVHAANPTDLAGPLGQIAQYLATTPASDPGALYTLWVGSNDVRSLLASGLRGAEAGAVLGQVATNVAAAVAALAADGARNVLLVLVPDLGLTPAARELGAEAQAAATAASAALNALLLRGTGAVADRFGLDLRVLGPFLLLNQATASPASFGFTNVTDRCLVGRTPCAPDLAGQNRFLFWDDLHPTAGGHAIIGAAALVAVPAPGGTVLILGAVALLALRRRQG